MGYELTAGSIAWRAETAGPAVVAFVELRRDGERAVIRDDTGRRVAPADLLAEAVNHAADPGARQSLAAVLADYVEAVRQRALEQARERWAALSSQEHQAALLLMESRREPTTDLRRREAEEVEQLRSILEGDGAWWVAGDVWAFDFGEPPQLLLDELARRHPREHSEQLLVGPRERTASANAGVPVEEPENDRMRPLISELLGSLSADDLVEIIAEAVRVNPAARSKAEALIREWRRCERTQQTRGAGASSPPPTQAIRPSSGRPTGPVR